MKESQLWDQIGFHNETMAPKSSPKGVSLTKIHTIGEKVGQGEFGEVYALNGSANDKKWVVKVVPVPVKPTKKKNSPPEVAARRLNHEYRCYSNCIKYSGSLLPRVPSSLKDKIDYIYFDNVGGTFSTNARKLASHSSHCSIGFSCLVMERLQCDFFDALPSLVESSSRFIELGKTASKLIGIVEAMHDSKYLIIDIKPDNFMVATLQAKVTDDSLSNALRLIDLGLAKELTKVVDGHISNDGTSELNGNALYASLNVHANNTPSRRDDILSVLLLIGEMILQVQALDQGTAPPYGTGDRASHLPWSQENSDELVGQAKGQILLRDSAFYETMPPDAADIMFDCITTVNDYTYKQKPEYAILQGLLSALKVPCTSNRKPGSQKPTKAQSVKSPPTRKSPRRRLKDDHKSNGDTGDQGVGDSSAAKHSPKVARKCTMYDDDDDVIMEEVSSADDDNIENEEANFMDLASVKGYGLYDASKDLWIVLSEQTGSSEIVVGSKPTGNLSTFTLEDDTLLPSHVTLSIPKNVSDAVRVKPRNKSSLVKVIGGKVPVGGTCVMIGQKVEIGSFSFKVRSLPVKASSKAIVRLPTTAAPKAHPRRAFLEIVAGSLRGNKYELIGGSRDIITIGSKPSGEAYLIALDEPGVAENHVQLELVCSKSSGTWVRVYDLGSTFGLEINDKTVIEKEMVPISNDSIIRLSDQASVSVTFMD